MADHAQRVKAYVAVGSNIELEEHLKAALQLAPGLRLAGTDRPLEGLFGKKEAGRDGAAMGDFMVVLRETLRKWTANA